MDLPDPLSRVRLTDIEVCDSESDDENKDNKVMMTGSAPARRDEAINVNPTEHDRRLSTPQKETTLGNCRRRWRAQFRKRFAVDVCIAAAVAGLICLMEFGYIPDGNLGFKCQDPMISHPFKGDTVTMTILLITAYFVPLFVFILIEIVREKSFRRIRVETIWFYYKEMLIGVTGVLLITEVMKLVVGEPRPHFLDSCEPDANLNCVPGTLIREYTCTNTRLSNYFKVDSARSFPSGHTSISIFISLFCAYLIQMRIPSENVTRLTKPLLICACLSWSLACSLTRITDRRHHWWDVLAGAFLGMFGALFSVKILHTKEKKDKNQRLRRASTTMTILSDVKPKDSKSNIV